MGGSVSTSTHVANAYDKAIYVRADAERRYLTMASFGVSGGAEGVEAGVEEAGSWDWHKIQTGFSRINPGHYLRFDVDVSASTTVYISVITEDGIVVADAIPKRADLSVIIGQNAQLFDTNHGSVWKDTSGNYHSGRKCRSVADEGAIVVRSRRALEVRSKRALEARSAPADGIFKPQVEGSNPSAIGDSSAIATPIAAVAGVCMVVLMAGLVVIGIKRRNRKN